MTPLASVMLALLVVWVHPDGQGDLVRHVRDVGGEAHVIELAELTEAAAMRHGIDPDLLAALEMHEGPEHIETPFGHGPLQVNPRQPLAVGGRCCSVGTPGCLAWHIDAGAMLLRVAIETCPDEWSALGQYRFGLRCIRRERDMEILRTRLLFRAARCVLDDAQRQTLRPGCAAREGLRASAMSPQDPNSELPPTPSRSLLGSAFSRGGE